MNNTLLLFGPWELIPVDDSPGEGVPVYHTGGPLLVELVSSTGSTVSTL